MFKRLWEYWVKGNWNVVVYGKTGKVKCRAVGLSGFRAEVMKDEWEGRGFEVVCWKGKGECDGKEG